MWGSVGVIARVLRFRAWCGVVGVTVACGSAAGQDSTRQGASLLRQSAPTTFGAYYYPEQWPRAQWKRDLDGIARLGFDFTHYAEFAWTYLEPSEGTFDFGWLDSALALADKAGLRVILGTPSAAPPSWMGQRYPQVYRVDESGRRHEHGIRAEVSLSNPVYQRFVDRIVTQLARRYGRDTRVWGWQVDNEPGSFADFSESARRDFQQWLRERYRTIDALNDAWGGSFWSSRYRSFEEVRLPNAVLASEDKLSPHALVDLSRFRADVTARFLDRQAHIIKRYARGGQWVTTNYTNITTSTDPRRSHAMDLVTFTMYPVAGANVLGGKSYAIGDPTRMMEATAYYRPITGTFGVMELQPGQVNWGSVNPQPVPGAVRMWIWHAWAAGASFVSTYRYRHPLRGPEMYHEGIVGTDGVTLSRTGSEFVETMREVRDVQSQLTPRAPMPPALAARRTAYLWSHDVYWDLETQPQTTEWSTWAVRNTFTQAVKSTGAPMDFVAEGDDLSRYRVLIAPAYQLVNPALVEQWRRFVEQGGHLIVTARTGQKNAFGHFHEGAWAAPLLDLIGADLAGSDMLPHDAMAHVEADGRSYAWHRWADVLVPRAGTTVLATYADTYYAGRAAVTTRRIGTGSVTMIGVSTDDGALEHQMVRAVYERAGIGIEDLPPGVFHEWRAGIHVAVNYNPSPATLVLVPGTRFLKGGAVLPPAGVAVWVDP
ncbi:MAG: beta-galactosidase [Gemmatimonadaceae bacterium]